MYVVATTMLLITIISDMHKDDSTLGFRLFDWVLSPPYAHKPGTMALVISRCREFQATKAKENF
jgi:hypothetical protein